MNFPKPKRKEDKKFLATFKHKPCLVCGKTPSEPDHIKTKGSGGGDVEGGVWPLCRQHHNERHNTGIRTFVLKYPALADWLERQAREEMKETK